MAVAPASPRSRRAESCGIPASAATSTRRGASTRTSSTRRRRRGDRGGTCTRPTTGTSRGRVRGRRSRSTAGMRRRCRRSSSRPTAGTSGCRATGSSAPPRAAVARTPSACAACGSIRERMPRPPRLAGTSHSHQTRGRWCRASPTGRRRCSTTAAATWPRTPAAGRAAATMSGATSGRRRGGSIAWSTCRATRTRWADGSPTAPASRCGWTASGAGSRHPSSRRIATTTPRSRRTSTSSTSPRCRPTVCGSSARRAVRSGTRRSPSSWCGRARTGRPAPRDTRAVAKGRPALREAARGDGSAHGAGPERQTRPCTRNCSEW